MSILNKKDIKKTLDEFVQKKRVSKYTVKKEFDVFNVSVMAEAGEKAEDLYADILVALPDYDIESHKVNLSVKEAINKIKADDVQKMLNQLKFGKKGFAERKGWDKNES